MGDYEPPHETAADLGGSRGRFRRRDPGAVPGVEFPREVVHVEAAREAPGHVEDPGPERGEGRERGDGAAWHRPGRSRPGFASLFQRRPHRGLRIRTRPPSAAPFPTPPGGVDYIKELAPSRPESRRNHVA